MGKVLVVDDEPGVLAAFEGMLSSVGHEVIAYDRADAALERLATDQPDVAVLDIFMPGTNGLEAIRRIKQSYPKLPVIIMTGKGTMESAIEATKLGAFDYQLKPFEPEEMLRLIGQAFESVELMQRQIELDPGVATPFRDAIVGQSAGMQQVYKSIGRVAPTDATVLVRGDSGTGKELVARAIYQYSRRAGQPMLVVNCVAFAESTLEGELFGYEQGATVGAETLRLGKLEQAHGGTILLDEIGDLPLGVQAKVLRVLQERTIERLGGSQPVHVDVRLIATTNRNLERAVAEGTFLEDLYHRLSVVTIQLPRLAERRDDIPRLTDYFLQKFARELGVAAPAIADDARQVLADYPWPGNVRELEHCLYRAMIFTRGYPIQDEDILRALERDAVVEEIEPLDDASIGELVRRYLRTQRGSGTHEKLLDQVDRWLVVEAVRQCHGNTSQASRMLGLRRPTLHAKMRRYGIQSAPDANHGDVAPT